MYSIQIKQALPFPVFILENCYFPSSEMDFTEEVDSCSGKSVSKGGLYPPRVGLAASSEARAVIETQGG